MARNLSLEQAATRTGKSIWTIRQWVQKGWVRREDDGLSAEDVEKVLARVGGRTQAGHPNYITTKFYQYDLAIYLEGVEGKIDVIACWRDSGLYLCERQVASYTEAVGVARATLEARRAQLGLM